jgi:AraC-like DNA-binding protein
MPWSRVLYFTEPLACQEAIQSVTQAEILPTAKGTFRAEVTQIRMNKLRMQRFKADLPLLSTVTIAPDRKLIGFLIEPSASNPIHCGMEIAATEIFVYGHDVLHQRSISDYHIATISLPILDFPTLCRTVVGREFAEKPFNSIVRPSPPLMLRLRKLHNAVGQLAHDAPDILERPEVCRALEEQLIHALMECLGDTVKTPRSGRGCGAVMVKFEEFLAANPDQPLYLTDICAAVGVAERTLRASCEEHLGMGPIRFLTLRRMHLVHRALLRADQPKSTVTRIVTQE